ncbi:hypothetical protein CH352_11920 [Leptospira hartskeerlii]|uniref:Uncharacterized protein n=1 Tax=Leptospira hartskeerlii TaxID=2023177 RepID=A0A2M9XB10_9LEPT|nr:hypothetical protein [Leptospira hartskeerlii]PJZ24875.1 hypothetical protein CH357_14960 [Leptospira hartskeerlii]PJZ33033.1 hypothetical protein CH352_11920 [Leptospira hartskeerlii]
MKVDNTVLSQRFCGPPKTGNGGFTAGILVEAVRTNAAEIRLLNPTPVETSIIIESEKGQRGAIYDDSKKVLATLKSITYEDFPEYKLPLVPDLDDTKKISAFYPGFTTHPFPTCFVCGPKREISDGMRIFVGPAPEQIGFENLMAGHWLPDETVASENGLVRDAAIWGALDCPGGFSAVLDEPQLIVLSKIRGKIIERPKIGENYTVVSWRLQKMSRAFKVMTAIFKSDSKRLMAIAEALWLAPRNWDTTNQDW